MTQPQIPVGEYLFRRITSLGIRHILLAYLANSTSRFLIMSMLYPSLSSSAAAMNSMLHTQRMDQQLLSFFRARPETGIASFSTQCHTVEELESDLSQEALKKAEYISLVELFFSPFDYPWRLATRISNTYGRPLEKQENFN
ncbi:PDC1-like protein [Fusarium globosum]|uniref:PDC1-like protein n=1 Tax=Fusarium globosum TaxID=78864 RepID=A0A8H5YAC2_9HYPO|nr:PDC1-like protein [Fusarium globosum]